MQLKKEYYDKKCSYCRKKHSADLYLIVVCFKETITFLLFLQYIELSLIFFLSKMKSSSLSYNNRLSSSFSLFSWSKTFASFFVAERSIRSEFASTEIHGFNSFLDCEFVWLKRCAFVFSIAEWLSYKKDSYMKKVI